MGHKKRNRHYIERTELDTFHTDCWIQLTRDMATFSKTKKKEKTKTKADEYNSQET